VALRDVSCLSRRSLKVVLVVATVLNIPARLVLLSEMVQFDGHTSLA
jgi:hypothetical protein